MIDFIYRTSCNSHNFATASRLSVAVVNKAHRWTDLDDLLIIPGRSTCRAAIYSLDSLLGVRVRPFVMHATSHIPTVTIEFHETVNKISAYIGVIARSVCDS